jgi:hypothetical protein
MASFKSAFAAARKGGKKEFKWNGKSYNTKLKSEGSKAPATSSRPTARPTAAAKPVVQAGRGAPASTQVSKNASPRPKARPTGQNKSGSIRQTGKKPPRKDLSDTVVGRALHKAEDGINSWRDRIKSKIKANRKPSTPTRSRRQG